MADKTIPDLTAAASVALTDLIEISDAGPSSKKATITQVQSAITSGFVPTSRTIATTVPLAGGGDLSANRTFTIADAAADGVTKGAAAFTAADFNSAAGVVSIDYVNGQKATALIPGFLTAADWTTFNSKQAALGFTPPPNTRLISTTSPLAGGGDLSADRTLSIADAAADGATKGASAFAAADFNAAAGVISIDYTNGQSASAVNKGFLTSADWTTFNSKQAALGFTPPPNTRLISTTAPLSGGGDLTADRTLSIADAAADGATKGAAAFAAADFDSAAGVISIDYTNGQSSSAVNKGFLTAADWTTFNSKASTEAPFVDTTALVKGSADATKLLRFEVDGFTTGTTRIVTPPNQNFTMAGIDVVQTFSAAQTFTPAANTVAININAVSVTGASSQVFSRIVGTWNTSGTPSAFLIGITDTASNAASKLIEFQVGGGEVFSVGKTGALNFLDGIRQIFNPSGTNAGINVGAHTTDPSAPVNGDLWYESTANELHARINGATVALGAGGGTAPFIDSTAIIKGSADATKLLRIEVDGFTTGTTRVATPPNQDFTIAGTDVLQVFSVTQVFTPAVDTSAIQITGSSITGLAVAPFLDISGTWNTTETQRAVLINITDTASDANSSLLRCELGGSFRMNVDKVGGIQLAGGVSALGGITSTFSLAGSSATSFIDLTGTWNTSGTPTGIRMNVTDTASNAVSKLIDLQIGAATKFAVDKTGSITFADGIRQIFNPNGTNAGINVGAHTDDPSSLTNGDLWYQSTANELRARINGATVALGAGGGASPPFDDGTAIIKGSADATKLFRIEVDGFTTGTTRIATPPNQDFTMAGTNVAQTFTVEQTFTPAANTEAITVTGFSLTGANAQSILDLSGTWNTSGTPAAIKLNITDTASNAGSSFLDLKVGGSSVFTVFKNGSFNAVAGNFAVASDGSFLASGGPFAVDVASNLTINNVLTFNNSGITITDDTSEFVFSGSIRVPSQIRFDATPSTILDDGNRLVFSSNIQIGAATLDDASGALETNTFKALTAVDVNGCQLTTVGGDTLIIESGFRLRLGTAAASGLLVATHSITVEDSTGTVYNLLCRS